MGCGEINLCRSCAQIRYRNRAFLKCITSFVSNIYVRKLGVRKKLIKNFIMYYLPDENNKTIVIARIVYSRRNMDEVLKNIELTNRTIDKQTNE